MPSLYFNYHIGGIKVSYEPKRNAFFGFMLNLCAVIGGVYALASFLNNTLQIFVSQHGYELIKWSPMSIICAQIFFRIINTVIINCGKNQNHHFTVFNFFLSSLSFSSFFIDSSYKFFYVLVAFFIV